MCSACKWVDAYLRVPRKAQVCAIHQLLLRACTISALSSPLPRAKGPFFALTIVYFYASCLKAWTSCLLSASLWLHCCNWQTFFCRSIPVNCHFIIPEGNCKCSKHFPSWMLLCIRQLICCNRLICNVSR